MPKKNPRLRQWNPAGLPLHELLAFSDFGRAAILECFNAQAEREKKHLDWGNCDWKRIDHVRMRYFNGRAMEITAIDSDDEFNATKTLILDACAKLIEATKGEGGSLDIYWLALSGDHPGLDRESIRTLAEALRNRTESIDRLVMNAGFRRVNIGDARSTLIASLAQHFRDKGLKPTASVDYNDESPPSPFVALIIIIMTSLPEALQDPAHSLAAFSRTVSRTLSGRTRSVE